MYTVAVFQNVQHSQAVDGNDLYRAGSLAVEVRSHIGGQRADIQVAVGKTGYDIRDLRGQGEVVIRINAVFGIIHELDGAHAGRAFEDAHADLRRISSGCGIFRSRISVCRHRKKHDNSQKQSYNSANVFHIGLFLAHAMIKDLYKPSAWLH